MDALSALCFFAQMLLSYVIASMVYASRDSAHQAKQHRHCLSMSANTHDDILVTNNIRH